MSLSSSLNLNTLWIFVCVCWIFIHLCVWVEFVFWGQNKQIHFYYRFWLLKNIYIITRERMFAGLLLWMAKSSFVKQQISLELVSVWIIFNLTASSKKEKIYRKIVCSFAFCKKQHKNLININHKIWCFCRVWWWLLRNTEKKKT